MDKQLADLYNSQYQAGIAMMNSGDVPLFGGVNEKMKGEMAVAVVFIVEDYRWDQMLTQLNKMERLGLRLFLTNCDFPAHVTIQVSEGGIESHNELIQDSVQIPSLYFNRLVIDSSGNIFLASEDIPQVISEWR